MATKQVKTKIIIRNDTEAKWKANDPVLSKGELAVSIDINKLKIGDGTTRWSALKYLNATADEVTTLSKDHEALKEKVDSLVQTGGEPNVLEKVKVNDVELTPIDKAVNVTIAKGTTDGSLSVNGTDVEVAGLKSAAYTESSAYDKAGAANAIIGTETDESTANTVYGAKKLVTEKDTAMDARVKALEGQNKADVADTLAGYGIKDAYTQTQTDEKINNAIASVMRYKGTKDTVVNLPVTGNVVGDVWHVTANTGEYAWNGTAWEELGSTIDLSSYLTQATIAGLEINSTATTITADQLKTALGIGAAAAKGVDETVASASTSENLPTSKAVASFVEGKGYATTTTTDALGERITTLEGKTTNVTKSDTNGNISVDGTDVVVYDITKDTLLLDGGDASTTFE